MANDNKYLPDSEVVSKVLELMERADPVARQRIVQTIQTFYGVFEPRNTTPASFEGRGVESSASIGPERVLFSENRSISPKEFLLEKRPQTDVEKVATLAYYLTHYLNVENFKTLDISKLNTDAAQIKFSNAAQAVDNATKAGYLISGTKGHKKLSAHGELYVQALPDRAAARDAIAHAKPKRRAKTAQKR